VEKWIKELPLSRVAYPASLRDQSKYWFWKAYARLYPLIRRVSYHLGIGKLFITYLEPGHTGRQEFLIGTLDPSRSARDFAFFLVEQGFGNHFIAWRDSGELVSLRRTVGFEHQYHIRVFKDGEVRGHYEFTPECHPFLHMVRVGFEDRTGEFKHFVQDWVLPANA
jgi:hypothetical protein